MRIGTKKFDDVFATLDEAIRVRDAIRRDIADEKMVPIDGLSVLALGPRFLRTRTGNRAHSTEVSRWNLHVAAAEFAKRPIRSIVRRDVREWANRELRETIGLQRGGRRGPLSFQTRKHCLNLLRRFFAWAVEEEYLENNPAAGVEIEREDGDESEGYQPGWYLTPEEHARLVRLADRRTRLLLNFAIGTGLRLNEMNCLHLDDVHLDGPKPHVLVRFGSFDRKKRRFVSPKGRKGEKNARKVPLFGLALEAAKEWKDNLPKFAKRNPMGLMFPTSRGALNRKPPRTWKKLAEDFGIIPRIGRPIFWHLLRHTFASSLVAGWWGQRWRLDDIRTVMGHSTVQVTERYAHLGESVVFDVAADAHTAWTAQCGHAVDTTAQNSEGYHKRARSSKPNVVRSNRTGRTSCVSEHRQWRGSCRCLRSNDKR
jgi:integrase